MNQTITPRTTCRISGEPLKELFSLGDLYMSGFLKPDQEANLPKVELKMMLAEKSGLVQLAHTPPFDEMYREYWYRSGTNATMTRELSEIAALGQSLMRTEAGDIWLDIGCNDGTLLSFLDPKLTRIGIDPAKNGYKQLSEKHANEIVEDYFTYENFRKTHVGNKKAKVITSIAMFYDLEDPNKFVRDIYNTLDDQGLWVIQLSYTPLMLKQLAFDNICHEHLEYYTLSSLKYLLDQNDFEIVDCQLNDVNGGSFRVFMRKRGADPRKFGSAPYRDVARARVESIFAYEQGLDLNNPKTYFDFYQRILNLRNETVNFIKTEKSKGKTVWAYGASTKGNTLLQWFGLDNTLIDGIAERQAVKYGLKTIGTNIPIYPEEFVRAQKPDYMLVLPWHFIDEFTRREADYLRSGGKFIVPCPKFEII